jgi:AraC-like DNA-binding protein
VKIRAPEWASTFETEDLDELAMRVNRWGDHRREVFGRGRFRASIASVSLPDGAVGWGKSSHRQRIIAHSNFPLVHMALTMPLTYRVGHRRFEALPNVAVYLEPGVRYELSYGAGNWMAVQVQNGELSWALNALLGTSRGPGVLHSREVPLAERDMADVMAIVTRAKSGGPGSRALGGGLTDWVSGRLAGTLPQGKRLERIFARYQHLEEWIEEHLDEHISLAALCRIAKVDARGLQKAFARRRGMTPMQWVKSRRMAAARLRLAAAGPVDSVTKIALANGFTQLGRFAVDYRKRYGESPSATLMGERLR